jgi:hypothetical protein
MSLYGIGLDVYLVVAAELIGSFGIIAWALKKSAAEEERASPEGSNRG